jgi:hypothetical protein
MRGAGRKPRGAAAQADALPYDSFREALAAFWRDAYSAQCGMISKETLPPLEQAPPAAWWEEHMTRAEHPLAGALAKAPRVPLLQSLDGWLARLRDLPEEARADGAAVGALLAARYARDFLAETAALRAHMAVLAANPGDTRRERKVWAAADALRLAEDEDPDSTRLAIMELYRPPGGTGGALAAALCADARGGDLLGALDRAVNCVKDLADLSATYVADLQKKATPAASAAPSRRRAPLAPEAPPPAAAPAAQKPVPATQGPPIAEVLPEAPSAAVSAPTPPKPFAAEPQPDPIKDTEMTPIDEADGAEEEEEGEAPHPPLPAEAVRPAAPPPSKEEYRRRLADALRSTLEMVPRVSA